MFPAERAHTDPHFRMLVETLIRLYQESCSSGAGFTPSEVREASGLAWQIYIQRHPGPFSIQVENE